MKVFIATEGGSERGLGHITRCESFLQAFRQLGLSPEFIIDCGQNAERSLQGRGYTVFNWLEEDGRLVQTIRGGDILIIDSYLAGIETYRRLSGAVRLSVYMDDLNRLDYPPGIVINGGINAQD